VKSYRVLHVTCTGQNTQHSPLALLPQAIYNRLTGYPWKKIIDLFRGQPAL
jgi:hypothetical protein